MKRDVMEKWVAALRGGDYMQGYGRLRQQGGSEPLFCALGVLCQVHHDETHSASWSHQPINDCWSYGRSAIRSCDRDRYSECLPACVMEWAGISSPNARLDVTRSVSSINDDGKDFATIADAIEARWKAL